MSDGDLRGWGALVIGGYGRFGAASARALVRDGAVVTLLGRKEERLRATTDDLMRDAQFGGRVLYCVGDATRASDVAAAVAAAEEASGSYRICYASVGGSRFAPLLLTSSDTWSWHFEINVLTAFLAVKHSVPAMTRAGGGSIVLTSSRAGKVSWPNLAPYACAKAAVEHLTRVAADELGHLGIRVNAIRPGLTRSHHKSGGSSDAPPPQAGRSEVRARYYDQIPLGRAGSPEDGAALVRFLAGPGSGYITGQVVAHDGGAELRRAPDVEPMLRQMFGDEKIDMIRSGRIPDQ